MAKFAITESVTMYRLVFIEARTEYDAKEIYNHSVIVEDDESVTEWTAGNNYEMVGIEKVSD